MKLTRHLADETRHAWRWTRRIAQLSRFPVAILHGYQPAGRTNWHAAMALSGQRIPGAFVRMGIRDHPVAARSPWQNGHVERLIGSIRRECLDHLVVSGEAHLRRVLKAYAGYYNEVRTHLSLGKDAPNFRRYETVGDIVAMPILGGLHHRYVRV